MEGTVTTAVVSSTVITMWTTKYHTREDFLAYFLDEQEYVDAMFIQIIALNYGIWLSKDSLHVG